MTDNFKKHLDLNIYQIYPRSFCDTNHDGIGDIRGVTSRLDYLKELGVNAIWMCPCYKSPNEDNGYDVADYYDIMDEFGTMDDIKELISEMHKRDMKLIMDLVPNHTSSEHKWFKESRKSKDNPYSDYYYWFDEPQNNWESCFGGSAWQFDEERGQYYLHSYAIGQPDLNWENPKVVEEMQKVVDFWVDLGVDGFRIDVIDQISKDWEKNRNCFGPHLHEYINALFGREKTKHIFTVGECWAGDIDEICRHCSEERGELVTLFQFDHINKGRKGRWKYIPEGRHRGVRDIITKWQYLTAEKDLVYSIFTDNHDQPQFIDRMGDIKNYRFETATMYACMFYLLKGATFIFQGQEFGTVTSWFDSIEDFDDIETVNYYKACIEAPECNREALMKEVNFGSRDNTRHPVAWNSSEYGGFSDTKTWLKPPTMYKEINLEADRSSEKSVFKFYQEILRLRNSSETIRYGEFKALNKPEDEFFVYERTANGEAYTVVCNFEKPSLIDIPEGELILSNYGRTKADGNKFKPYETAVYLKK